jgi:large subunit ribosomal protein L17
MHRHGYKGRKFGREKDQRRALLKSLADALVLNEKIETTLPKAKELVPYTEVLITKAKTGSLHSRRQIINAMSTKEAAHKLVDEIAPKLTGRSSGHLRIKRSTIRRGDGTQMAIVSFVDDLSKKSVAEKTTKPAPSEPKTKSANSPAASKESK